MADPENRAGGGATPKKQTEAQREVMRRLKSRLEADGLDLRSAAQKLDCSASTLSRLIAGKVGLSSRHEERIRCFMGETVDADLRALEEFGRVGVEELERMLQIMQRMLDVRRAMR